MIIAQRGPSHMTVGPGVPFQESPGAEATQVVSVNVGVGVDIDDRDRYVIPLNEQAPFTCECHCVGMGDSTDTLVL